MQTPLDADPQDVDPPWMQIPLDADCRFPLDADAPPLDETYDACWEANPCPPHPPTHPPSPPRGHKESRMLAKNITLPPNFVCGGKKWKCC